MPETMETARSEYIRHYDSDQSGLMEDGEAKRAIVQVLDDQDLMEPGTRPTVQAGGERLKWMLVAVGAFLAARGHEDYELNDDYTRLRRLMPWRSSKERQRFRHTVSE